MHSIAPHDLQRHLRKCNQRSIILGPFHRPNCNSGLECEDHDDYPTILRDISDDELREFILRMETIHDQFINEPLQTNPTNSDCHLANVHLEELGNRARKHLEQIGSIIAQLVHLNLLQSKHMFCRNGCWTWSIIS